MNDVEITILKRFVSAVGRMIDYDMYLLEKNVHEQTIGHRIAVYMEDYFPEENIDCEYNKNGDLSKTIDDIVINKPDIIVHRRGLNSHNTLCIEIKKGISTIGKGDLRKLKGLTKYVGIYRYTLGIFLEISTRVSGSRVQNHPIGEYKLTVFKDGEKVDRQLLDNILRM
jgi:hypothetical protein